MPDMNIKTVMNLQRDYFRSGKTLPFQFRIDQLYKLRNLLEKHEKDFAEALNKDLNKSEMEGIVSEILLIIDELNYIIKNLKKWMHPKKVTSPFPLCWPGRSEIYYEPYGSVLVMGPWNYPIMLVLSPLIGAICAGNCVILKPSEISSHTQDVIVELISKNFSPEYIYVYTGGPQEVSELLEEKFDYIFFTGGTQIGKVVMQAAAKHLTPVTLELGGKNPCIVDESANLDFAARRIIWAKYLNAGQLCLAPDYLLVHHSCKNALINKLKNNIIKFYGEDAEKSSSYCRIINKKHFDRIKNLMKKGNILFGGKSNESKLYISPTLIEGISWEDPIMQEEIFGPILPIFTYSNNDDLINLLKSHSKSLALYLFTKDKNLKDAILNQVSFGGGCINDCVMQIANYHLPFGGVGPSGMGSYHGKYSFETFSHRKSIYTKPMLMDVDLIYPPYTPKKLLWLKRLMKWSGLV